MNLLRLRRLPNSMSRNHLLIKIVHRFLDRLVNQEDEGGMAAMDDGRSFIDRDGDIFGLVLDYLRSAGESVPQFDPETLRRLRIDADARRRVSFVRARAPSRAH